MVAHRGLRLRSRVGAWEAVSLSVRLSEGEGGRRGGQGGAGTRLVSRQICVYSINQPTPFYLTNTAGGPQTLEICRSHFHEPPSLEHTSTYIFPISRAVVE